MRSSLIALIIGLNALQSIVVADPRVTPAPTPTNATERQLGACNTALRACSNLVDDQDSSITALKVYSKQLESQVEKDEKEPVPIWVWIGLGVVGGGVVGWTLHK